MIADDTPTWKPATCTDCGAPFPSWSFTGPIGPWRCMSCHTVAFNAPRVRAPEQATRAPASPQGSLL